MSAQPTTLLPIFRIVNGERVPYVLELDDTMSVINEYPADQPVEEAPPAHVAPKINTAMMTPDALERYPDLDEPAFSAGEIHDVPLPGGGVKRYYKPSKLDIKVGEWSTPGVEENPIPGTDELRAEFFEAERLMNEKAKTEGAACSSCDLGALIRRFRYKLNAGGFLDAYK